jgi:hypothetical protein
MSDVEYKPRNQETDNRYNREPGIEINQGSNYALEMQKHEQFPSKYGQNPGNPYRYRPYPKMLYRAENYKGKLVCMAAQPDPGEFSNPGEFQRAEESARRFTEKCQTVVNDEREYQRAMESGWRESPDEAVAFLSKRERDVSTATAERNYDDRNMSEPAKREIEAAVQAAGGVHVPEIAEQPKKRRGRPPKIKSAPEAA